MHLTTIFVWWKSALSWALLTERIMQGSESVVYLKIWDWDCHSRIMRMIDVIETRLPWPADETEYVQTYYLSLTYDWNPRLSCIWTYAKFRSIAFNVGLISRVVNHMKWNGFPRSERRRLLFNLGIPTKFTACTAFERGRSLHGL